MNFLVNCPREVSYRCLPALEGVSTSALGAEVLEEDAVAAFFPLVAVDGVSSTFFDTTIRVLAAVPAEERVDM